MTSLTTTSAPSRFGGLLDRLASVFFRDVRPVHLAAIAVQLGLVLLVMRLFRVEETFGFLRLTPLVFGGFLVHALLPLRWRPAFFLLLSFAAIGMIFGAVHGLGLIVIGLGLVGICHLPVLLWMRVGLLLAAGAGLVAVRAEWVETSWESLPTFVLPILASMFMFRLAVYLYDLRHEKKGTSLWQRLSYFFMLPNVCFPLFPVVDYQMYRRTYYDAEAASIYQKGVLWMMRGVMHLLLYRVVYYHLVPSPAEVQDLSGVVLSMVSTYLLYLRISGQFHLIVGLLCLFGYNLPETHHLYFLAGSFTDYWRRINIYWKDFMMKLFYYPVFMRVRRWGMTTALVVSTAVVFAGTWALHSYQWFWLRGTFPVTATDGLFWGILGLLVVVNAVREAKRGRRRTLKAEAWSWKAATVNAAKVVGMFVVICVLWSLWSSTSVREFGSLLAVSLPSPVGEWLQLGLVLVGLVGAGVLLQYAQHRGWSLTPMAGRESFLRSAIYTSAVALLLVATGLPQVQGRMGAEAGELIASVQEEKLNKMDEERQERGYYEALLETPSYLTSLWRVQRIRPAGWDQSIVEAGLARDTDDIFVNVLLPSVKTTFKQATIGTNRWGMRDQEYAKTKDNRTYRIGLLGASYEMGWGVSDKEVFESRTERRLNRRTSGDQIDRFEILNFAAPGYTAVQYVALSDAKLFEFDPDAVFYPARTNDVSKLMDMMHRILQTRRDIPYATLKEVQQESGIYANMSRDELTRRLLPFAEEIIDWGYRRIVRACRDKGVIPVWIFVPRIDADEGDSRKSVERMSRRARKAGFVTLSLDGAFDGYDRSDLWLAPWDSHPNALAHSLLSEKLYEQILEHASELGLDSPAEVSTHSDKR